ncbi:MAG: hypothetical protein ACREAM_00960, partial [Blastocatellia bacterium]
AAKAGVNRVIWDLRHDGPRITPETLGMAAGAGGAGGPGGGRGFGGGGGGGASGGQGRGAQGGGAAGAGEAGAEGGGFGGFGGRFGGAFGPAAIPGEYTIKLSAGGKELSKTVQVKLDPRIKISDEDLAAQLAAAWEAAALSASLNDVVSRIDDLTRQLTALGETTRRGATAAAPANAVANTAGGNDGNGATRSEGGQAGGATGEISTALDQLKKLRSKLVRECAMNYRCPAMLREEAQSLVGSVSNGIAPPTEGQKLRLREMTEETAKVVEEFNSIVNGSIRKINDRMSSQPHIATGAPVK